MPFSVQREPHEPDCPCLCEWCILSKQMNMQSMQSAISGLQFATVSCAAVEESGVQPAVQPSGRTSSLRDVQELTVHSDTLPQLFSCSLTCQCTGAELTCGKELKCVMFFFFGHSKILLQLKQNNSKCRGTNHYTCLQQTPGAA